MYLTTTTTSCHRSGCFIFFVIMINVMMSSMTTTSYLLHPIVVTKTMALSFVPVSRTTTTITTSSQIHIQNYLYRPCTRLYYSHNKTPHWWYLLNQPFYTTTKITASRSIRSFWHQNHPKLVLQLSSSSSSSNNDVAISTLTPTKHEALSSNESSYDEISHNEMNQNKKDYERYYHCFFDQQVPEGRCVGIQLLPVPNDHINSFVNDHLLLSKTTDDYPRNNNHHHTDETHRSSSSKQHWLYDYLHPEEIQYGLQLHHIHHRQSFYMGRLAIRHALQQPPLSLSPMELWSTNESISSSLSSSSIDVTNPTCAPTTSINKSSTSVSHTTETIHHNQNGDSDNGLTSWNNNNNSNTTTSSSSSSIRNSILKDMYGRPQLPSGYLGSISHKGLIGVALVQEQKPSSSASVAATSLSDGQLLPKMGIGVDIEDISNAHRRRDVSRKVLTPNEIQNLGTLTYQYHHPTTSPTGTSSSSLQYLSIEEEILLRFSCKESVYKAIHPMLNQYVSFQEAEIQPYINGTAMVTLHLAPSSSTNNPIQKQEQQFRTPIILHWYRYENFIITTASIRLQ